MLGKFANIFIVFKRTASRLGQRFRRIILELLSSLAEEAVVVLSFATSPHLKRCEAQLDALFENVDRSRRDLLACESNLIEERSAVKTEVAELLVVKGSCTAVLVDWKGRIFSLMPLRPERF